MSDASDPPTPQDRSMPADLTSLKELELTSRGNNWFKDP